MCPCRRFWDSTALYCTPAYLRRDHLPGLRPSVMITRSVWNPRLAASLSHSSGVCMCVCYMTYRHGFFVRRVDFIAVTWKAAVQEQLFQESVCGQLNCIWVGEVSRKCMKHPVRSSICCRTPGPPVPPVPAVNPAPSRTQLCSRGRPLSNQPDTQGRQTDIDR